MVLMSTEPAHAEAEGEHSVDCNDSDGTRGAPNTMVYFNDMDGKLRADKLTDHKVCTSMIWMSGPCRQAH